MENFAGGIFLLHGGNLRRSDFEPFSKLKTTFNQLTGDTLGTSNLGSQIR